MKRSALILVAMFSLSTGACRSDSPKEPENVRLKGRNMSARGHGIAFFWNTTDDATRRAIVVGGALAVAVGIGFGIRRFFREAKALRQPRVRQPWETATEGSLQ